MSRIVRYDMIGDYARGPIPKETRQRINDVQCQMNQRFTWTNEQLALQLDGESIVPYLREDSVSFAAKLGQGSTDVGCDDWNAVLIVRFLRWVSTLLVPNTIVRLHDTGTYLIPTCIRLCQGRMFVDSAAVERVRKSLTAEARLSEFNERVAKGHGGHWFQAVSILGYLDRPEVADLHAKLGNEMFRALTLEDAADHMAFPWEPEQLNAA